jgi:hypothetical protein
MIRRTKADGVVRGWLLGRRDFSLRLRSSRQRRIHLYPVWRVMPKSSQIAVNEALFSRTALMNLDRCSIGHVSRHGIA